MSQLRRLQKTEQVAAVCYRLRGGDIEFLLVQTRGGRWTFPKGGVEPGLSHAQAAALEAFEEAGVHGRIDEASFTGYRRVDRRGKQGSVRQLVNAHLCEVLRLGPPQETGRSRTWFSPEKAKLSLRTDRQSKDGIELARVVDRAVICIQRLKNQTGDVQEHSSLSSGAQERDALQRVQFEACANEGPRRRMDALYTRYIRRQGADASSWGAIDFAGAGYLGERVEENRVQLQRFDKLRTRIPQLSGDTAPLSAVQNVTAIDDVRGNARKARH